MLLRLDHPGDGKGTKRCRRVLDPVYLKAQISERSEDFIKGGIRFQMVLQPVQR